MKRIFILFGILMVVFGLVNGAAEKDEKNDLPALAGI